jgi:CIC family chloride channel protein
MDIAEKEESDVILLGASRENLMQRALRGNIPEAIARQNERITILVRGTRS